MSSSIFRSALAAAVAAGLALAPSALARGPVYGGSTRAAHAIVLRTDAKAKKLKSAVIAWSADCKDGNYWADGSDLTVVRADPGFSPDPDELAVTRNARGRFSGRQAFASSAGDLTGHVTVEVAGRVKGNAASGTLHASVSLVDDSGNVQNACDSGTIRWTAKRAPGRIYGGATSQDAPMVLRLNRAGRNVSDLMTGWGARCVPDGAMSIGDRLTDFPIKNHRFGDAFSRDYSLDDGSKRTFAYKIAGKLARTKASGSLRVKVTQTDPTGAQTLSCDSGTVTWKALTG
jgi:hypothetical protein